MKAILPRKVCGLTRRELADALKTFPVVKMRHLKAPNEHRTKRRVLEAFARMGWTR